MKWLAYSAKVIANLFYIVVVLAVFATLRDPMEKEIIAVLGLIYTAMRSIAIGQAIGLVNALSIIDRKVDHIQYQVDSSYEKPDYAEADDLWSFGRRKLYIDIGGLSIISLICLYAFFSARG